jgi:hypothetical protein
VRSKKLFWKERDAQEVSPTKSYPSGRSDVAESSLTSLNQSVEIVLC